MKSQLPVRRIVSGGQTGVDRAALNAAIALGWEHGGWCPRGRRAEDGPIPLRYELSETDAAQYRIRTRQNVLDSQGTLILYRHELTGGSLLTEQLARRHGRAVLAVDLEQGVALGEIAGWLRTHQIEVLNVAGPRESSAPGIQEQAQQLLLFLFSP
jgi:hypothetical protein